MAWYVSLSSVTPLALIRVRGWLLPAAWVMRVRVGMIGSMSRGLSSASARSSSTRSACSLVPVRSLLMTIPAMETFKLSPSSPTVATADALQGGSLGLGDKEGLVCRVEGHGRKHPK